MDTTAQQRERALKLAERLLEITPADDTGLLLSARQIRDRLRTPMASVLAKVPGESVAAKARSIGITRQAYYCWLRGEYRPNMTQAKRLARLTGFPVEDIRAARAKA